MSHAYRKDIDGLRALAVIPVVLFHAQVAGFGGGFVGVDVFFVISGFLITQVIAREIEVGGFSYVDFWERRARRLLPAILFMAIGCCIGAWFLYLPDQMRGLGASVVALAGFGSNFWFWWKSGYFEAPADSTPLLHTWSLGVEEQFYLLFPLLLMFLYRSVRARMLTALVAVTLISLGISIYQVAHYPDAAYFLLPARGWELLIGALLALGVQPAAPQSRLMREALMALGLVMVVVPMFTYNHYTPFPGMAALAPCLGTGLLIFAGNSGDVADSRVQPSLLQRLLELDLMVFFGRLSFSLYLWHWPLLAVWSVVNQRPLDEMTALDVLLVVSASVVMAWISLRFVEEPIRRRRALAQRGSLFLASGACLGLLAAFGLLAKYTDGFPQRIPEPIRQVADASRDNSSIDSLCIESHEAILERGEFCELGPTAVDAGEPGFLLWGDSHSRSLVPVFQRSATAVGVRGWHASMPGCPPLFDVEIRGETASRYCAELNAEVRKFVSKHSVPIVFLASRWNANRIWAGERKLWPTDPSLSQLPVDEVFERQFRQTIEFLVGAGARVVVIDEVPYPRHYHPWRAAYAIWKGADPSDIGLARANYNMRSADYTRFMEMVGDLELERIRTADYFCSEDFCPALIEGQSNYKDGHHLTPSGSMFLFEPVQQLLRGVLKSPET